MKHVYIIAEAGVNHNGDINIACDLVAAAAEAGVDAVKFQTFKAEKLTTKSMTQAEYQRRNMGTETMSQYEMLKRLELSEEDHFLLRDLCRECGLDFLSTAFDLDSLAFLSGLSMPYLKVPSGEIVNIPYLRRVASYNQQTIVSTGMATLGEIETALSVMEDSGLLRSKVTVLHCTSDYPAAIGDVNLRAMLSIGEAFNVAVGYSDHTTGIEVPIAAVALGAAIIEKHFTMNRNLPGPDHKASLEVPELKAMVQSIRNIESAMGDGIKRPSGGELKNRDIARKKIVAMRTIRRGEIFNEANLTVKRSDSGLSASMWDYVIGKPAPKDIREDEGILFF